MEKADCSPLGGETESRCLIILAALGETVRMTHAMNILYKTQSSVLPAPKGESCPVLG